MNEKKSAFVEAVSQRVQALGFPDYIKETPAEIAAALVKDGEVFISGELTDAPVPGGSKVGGRPDVEAEFEWPTEEDDEDAPLQFIAQINLAEVHPHDLDGRLPAKGMLWFFSIADANRAGGYEIDASTTAVRYAADPGELAPHDLPEAFEDDENATIDERRIVFGPTIYLGGRRDRGITKVIEQALREAGGRRGPVFMLNVRDGDNAGVMLADFDGYAIARYAFGEGSLGFVLSSADLAAGELAKADTAFETGT